MNCLPLSAYELTGNVHIACTAHEQLLIKSTITLHTKDINFDYHVSQAQDP